MTRMQVTFLLAGLGAGFVSVVGARAMPILLLYGVGPVFFIAVLLAITASGSWPHVSSAPWRILAAICICTGSYLLAVFTFWIVGGYAPQLFGVRASTDPIDFGSDILIGLLAAALVASVGVEFIVYVLTGKWNNSSLFRLLAAGVVTILVTFAVDRAAHRYWAFYGVLLPVGEGLFCAVVGAQIWRASEQAVRG